MNKQQTKIASTMLELAEDLQSELYVNGVRRGRAIHRIAFWRGVDNDMIGGRVPYERGSLAYACFKAGREFAQRHPEAVRQAHMPSKKA